jgi:hypothetical protein
MYLYLLSIEAGENDWGTGYNADFGITSVTEVK